MADAYIKRENVKRVNEGKSLLAQPKRRARAGMRIHYVCDHKDPLSNNYRYNFKYNEVQFFTAAHAYYCAKAEFYHESGYYREIKNVLFGHNVYRLGRKIRIDDRWDKVRVGIMRDILQAKMEQCAKYRTRLAKCNGLIVAACHDDDYWYSGAKKEAVLKNGEYPGQNMLGLLHTEMRNEMKDKEEDFPEGITAKAMDSVATASAASSDQAPPAKPSYRVLQCEFYCLEKSFVRDVVLKELNAHTVIGQCRNASLHILKDFVMHATRNMINLRQSVE